MLQPRERREKRQGGERMSDRFTTEPATGTVVVRAGGAVVAESQNALLLRENGYEPVYYLPRGDAGMEFLERSDTQTHCPHKGDATYYNFIAKSGPIADAAWSYEDPLAGAEAIRNHLAFFRDKVTIEVL